MPTATENTYWLIEFGFEPNRDPMSFGPFDTEADAKRELALILDDNPHAFDSGYRIAEHKGRTVTP